jgi:hypothetical protein
MVTVAPTGMSYCPVRPAPPRSDRRRASSSRHPTSTVLVMPVTQVAGIVSTSNESNAVESSRRRDS